MDKLDVHNASGAPAEEAQGRQSMMNSEHCIHGLGQYRRFPGISVASFDNIPTFP
jgi:hypothetical protein